jgi:hypothetical protein
MILASAFVTAILGSLLVAWANLRTDEPTVVLAFALPIVLVSSVMRPSVAPLFGMLVGAAVPVSTWLACVLAWRVPYTCSMTTVYQSCIVFLFTLPVAGIGFVIGSALFPAASAR